MDGYRGRTIFCPPGPVPLRYTSVNSCSGGGLGRGGYRVAPLLSGDVVEKGAAVVMKMLLLPAITVCRKMPWLRAVKPAGPRAFIHHIAWLDCPVWAASYRKQQQQTRPASVRVWCRSRLRAARGQRERVFRDWARLGAVGTLGTGGGGGCWDGHGPPAILQAF